MWRIGGFCCLIHLWGCAYLTLGPVLLHLLHAYQRFLYYLYEEDPVESKGMVFQTIAVGNSPRIDLCGYDGTECLIKAAH